MTHIAPLSLRRSVVCMSLILLICGGLGCASDTSIRAGGAKAAATGVQLCDAALATFDKIEALQEVDRRQQQLLAAVDGSGREVKVTGLGRQLELRREAFGTLKKTYTKFAELSNVAFGDQVSTATTSLLTSYNALDGVKDISNEAKQLIPKIAGVIAGQIQAGQIQKHNAELYRIAEGYHVVWKDDAPIFKEKYADVVFSTYANSITGSFKAEKFDEKALSALMKTPFSKDINVFLYQDQLRQEARKSVGEVKSDIDKVDRAFGLLLAAHKELSSPQPLLERVQYNLTVALTILETINKN